MNAKAGGLEVGGEFPAFLQAAQRDLHAEFAQRRQDQGQLALNAANTQVGNHAQHAQRGIHRATRFQARARGDVPAVPALDCWSEATTAGAEALMRRRRASSSNDGEIGVLGRRA